MNFRPLAFPALAFSAPWSPADPVGAHLAPTEQAGQWELSWQAESTDSYFFQVSYDLRQWFYAPFIETGIDGAMSAFFYPTTDRFFVRIRSSNQAEPDPDVADFDLDGLLNMAEILAGLDPLDPDTDKDALPDGWESVHGLDPLSQADAALDPDHDGLANLAEFLAQTNPKVSDTDGDGCDDGAEADQGHDPLDPIDHPFQELLVVVGQAAQGVRVTAQRTITLQPNDGPFLILVATATAEYPVYTGQASSFNDTVDWTVSSLGMPTLSGSADVNDFAFRLRSRPSGGQVFRRIVSFGLARRRFGALHGRGGGQRRCRGWGDQRERRSVA